MSVQTAWAMTVNTTEVLTTNVPAASSPTVNQTGYSSSDTINAGTTVPATLCAYFLKALSSGSATLDLTSLVGTGGAAVDFTGLKVQIAKFKNSAGNANTITVTFGASNPYLLAGSAWKAILAPGQEVMFSLKDQAPDVDSTHKTIDIAGTGAQTLEVALVAG